MEPFKPIEPPIQPPTAAEWPRDLPPGVEVPGAGACDAADGVARDGEAAAGGPEPDFELLENYLDGELSPVETRRVERRLIAEPELSAALARMSAEYALRRAAFRSLEPDERTADAISESFVRSARQSEGLSPRRSRSARQARSLRIGRIIGALAACVAISFCAGWVGRGYAVKSQAKAGPASSAVAPEKAEPSVYQVALTDEAGNITAVQKFDNLEEAKSFAADVGRWQARQQQLRRETTATGPTVPTSSGL